jgi:type IV pilus assembly protein PilE
MKTEIKVAMNVSTKFSAKPRPQSGFTLIEMMAVLLIIGILTTFAYPAYRQVKLKTSRSEGRAALMRLMQQQERYYSSHHRYRYFTSGGGDSGDSNTQFLHFSGATDQASAYKLDARACGSADAGQSGDLGDSGNASGCLLLRATPAHGFDDPLCEVLTLDSIGRQAASGSAAGAADSADSNQSGSGSCW